MKRIRLIPALMLCLVLIAMSTSALAAPKAATTVPTVKITVPKGTIRGGVGDDLTITPSMPGFLTLKLLTEDGAELATLCDFAEVHTKANTIEFEAVDSNGDSLPEGSYVLSATMVSQYGVQSKETTAKIKLGSPKPQLSNVSISSDDSFRLTVDYYAAFDDKEGASVMLSLYRSNPQAMYFDDFPEEELKTPGASSATLNLLSDNSFATAVGYYAVRGTVTEIGSGISSNEIDVAFVIDADGAAYLLEDASDEVLESVDAAIADLLGESEDEEAVETEDESGEEVAVEAEDESGEEVAVETEEESGDEEAVEAEDEEVVEDEDEEEPKSESKPKSTASNTTGYQQGNASIGVDGLEIGAGVSDVAAQTDAGYWTLSRSASDEEIWAALIRPMTSVDVAVNESAYVYDSPKDGRKRLGTVSGLSQGLNVIQDREDGWSLVEVFRNEDGAFIRGYVRTNKLRVIDPNPTYGIVIDKGAQRLTVWKDGKPIGSCDVSTGLPTSKYLHRETPAGEYVLVTRRGTREYYGMGYSKYSIRFNGNYNLCEIPTTKKNGSDYSLLEETLGEKATRGHICVAHEASSDGGINAEWIWELTDENKNIKLLILDDKDRSEVPVGE